MLYEDFVEYMGDLAENNVPVSTKTLKNTLEGSDDISCFDIEVLIKLNNTGGYSLSWKDHDRFSTMKAIRINDIAILTLTKISDPTIDTSILLKISKDKKDAIIIGVAKYRYSGELEHVNKVYINDYIEKCMINND